MVPADRPHCLDTADFPRVEQDRVNVEDEGESEATLGRLGAGVGYLTDARPTSRLDSRPYALGAYSYQVAYGWQLRASVFTDATRN